MNKKLMMSFVAGAIGLVVCIAGFLVLSQQAQVKKADTKKVNDQIVLVEKEVKQAEKTLKELKTESADAVSTKDTTEKANAELEKTLRSKEEELKKVEEELKKYE